MTYSKNSAAGKTANRIGWGMVALAGVVLGTIDGSELVMAASVAAMALGLWRGGYMSNPKAQEGGER